MDFIKKAVMGLIEYLSEWQNLLNHAVIGVFFLLIAIYTPVNIFFKLGVISVIVVLNIRRMKKKNDKEKRARNEYI